MDRKPPSETPEPVAPVGGVRRDEQGNAVWQWAKQAVDSTSRMLRKLDVPGLRILDDDSAAEERLPPTLPASTPSGGDMRAPIPASPRATGRRAERGYDPYEGRATPAARPAVKPGAARAAVKPAAPVTKPSFLARLFGRR